MLPYNKRNITNAKSLRKNMTPWEQKLWYQYLCTYPVRFQRQKAIDNFIADFYCAKARIVVELDGGGHFEATQIIADEKRTQVLKTYGLAVVRFSNLDIDNNFEGVCETIDITVKKSLPRTMSQPAPSTGGA